MRDLYHNLLVTQHLSPVVSTTAKTSTAIDLQGFDSVEVVFAIGLSADTLSGSVYWTLKLQHSDDNVEYADTAAADHSGSATVVIDAASEDETSYAFGYVGNKRYLKAVATPTGTHSNGTPIGIIALRGTPAYRPAV